MTKILSLSPDKQYKVSGTLLHYIICLTELYESPYMVQDGKSEEISILPFQSERRDYYVGRIVSELNCGEVEEV